MRPDWETLKAAILEGDEVAALQTRILLAEGASPREILEYALLPAMDIVSWRLHTGEWFLPDGLASAGIAEACLDVVEPPLSRNGGSTATVVLGTVEGDVHNIGKNLVAALLRATGFKVINLGVGITPAQFVAVVQEHEPAILGLSALLSSTLPHMGRTIVALDNAGLRDRVRVICGGAPVSQAFCDEIGADAYGPNASVGVERCKMMAGSSWLGAPERGSKSDGVP